MVVYDPERQHRDICLELVTYKTAVVDRSVPNITGRAEAIADLCKLCNHDIDQLLV